MTYAEKLKDSRWQKKRLELLEAAGWQCQQPILCESPPNSTLAIHHKLYLRKVALWDYEDWGYEVLCEACHERQQAEMEAAHSALAKFPELQMVCAAINRLPADHAAHLVALLFQIEPWTEEALLNGRIEIMTAVLQACSKAFSAGWRHGVDFANQPAAEQPAVENA